jgi:hypothetical protein
MSKFIAILCVIALLAVPSVSAKGKGKGNKKCRSVAEVIKKRDKNGDAVLTLEEFVGKPKKEERVAKRTKRFPKIDANNNKTVNAEELTSWRKNRKARKNK